MISLTKYILGLSYSMGSYILSDGVAKTVAWIGAVGYVVSFLTFVLKFLIHNIDYTFENFVKYGMLLVGFFLLSVSTIRKAMIVQKDRKHMEDPDFFFHKLSRMGWACMAFHFITLYTLPHNTYIYYLFALIGYGLLAMGQQLGAFSLSTFYITSIVVGFFARPSVDYIQLPSKVLNMIYIATYAYIFAVRYFKRQDKKEPKDE